MLLTALSVMGSMALAQSQQAPTADHNAHHDQTGQQTEPPMGGAPMTEGMVGQSKQGMMGPGMMQWVLAGAQSSGRA